MKVALENKDLWIRESAKYGGLWEAYPLLTKVSNEELVQRLKAHNRTYLDKPDFECWDAIFRGLVPGIKWGDPQLQSNHITRAYLKDIEDTRLLDFHTPQQDGVLRYLSVGKDNTPETGLETQLGDEIYRAAPLTRAQTTSGAKFVLMIPFDEVNVFTPTAVAAGSWSTTVFDVDSATGLAEGMALEVNTAPKSRSRIIGLSGVTVTLDPAEPLLAIPTDGMSVTPLIGETGSHGNSVSSLATLTLGTGVTFSRSSIRLLKNEDLAWFLRFTFIREML